MIKPDTRRPYLPLYCADWIASRTVATMTLAQRGLFIQCLLLQWMDGPLPADLGQLARLCGNPSDFNDAWPGVASCFTAGADGRLANDRLEAIRAAADELRWRRQGAGRAGAEARHSKHHGKPLANTMADPQRSAAGPHAGAVDEQGTSAENPAQPAQGVDKQPETWQTDGKQGGKPVASGVANACPSSSSSSSSSIIKNKKPPAVAQVPVPLSLADSPEFAVAWEAWLEYRMARGKFLPPTAAAQLRMLAKLDPAGAIACLNQSILNGWVGLFPVNQQPARQETARRRLEGAGGGFAAADYDRAEGGK